MRHPDILYIMQCANLGGMEKGTLEMMSAARKLGCENRLISLNPIGGLGPLLKERGIPARGLRYRGPAGVLSIPEMARAFRDGASPDGIVMSGHNLSAFIALAGHRCKNRLLFVHFHHKGVMPRSHWRIVYAAAMRIFPRVAFCADFIRQEAEEIYPPLQSVSLTQPCSLNVPALPSEHDRATARTALGVPEGAYVVGNAGWLIERKRWDVFLRTASRIVTLCPKTMFLACGDGPMREELIKLSIELGLEGRIRWLGWQQNLNNFYRSLDVLLFNSDWDAIGLTPLEAAAYGTPVVASVLHGGLHEFIQSEEKGFLINRHDEQWLADKVLLLLQSPNLRRRTAAACREVLVERHDPWRNAIKLLELLELGIPVEQTA
jgi:glycosyltransferase involved in cell wall biosynthesis